MSKNEKNKLPYNTAYLNLNLLDELDYVIGGYGKPNLSFIYTLNNFVETYVLNEKFLFSTYEWDHFTIGSKVIFENGRPIWDILFEKGDQIIFIGWPIYLKGSKVLYVKPVIEGKDEGQDCINEFQEIASEEIKEKYFKPAAFIEFDQNYTYLSKNFGLGKKAEKQYLILEITEKPTEILTGLYNQLSSYNYHSVLPFNGLKAELNFNSSLLPSNQSYKILSELHNQKIEKLTTYAGYKKIPIPPLVSILLSQCKNLQDIPIKLKQLRHDFTELRSSFTELEKKIDSSENIKEQMDALDGLQDFWKAFSKKYDSGNNRLFHHFWDLKKASGLNKATEKVVDSESVEGFLSNLNTVALAGKVVGKSYSFFKDKKSINRFKGMTNLWELFQKSPTLENQAKDYERIFKVKIDLKELNKLSQIVQK